MDNDFSTYIDNGSFADNNDIKPKLAMGKHINTLDPDTAPFYRNTKILAPMFGIIVILIIVGIIIITVFVTRVNLENEQTKKTGFGYLPDVASPYKAISDSQNLQLNDSSFVRPGYLNTIPSSSLELPPIDLVSTSHWALSNDIYTLPYYMRLVPNGISITVASEAVENDSISASNIPNTFLSILFNVSQDVAPAVSRPLAYRPKLVQISPLTATYSLGGNANSRVLAYVCRGCPFITFELINAGLTFVGTLSPNVQIFGNIIIIRQFGIFYAIYGFNSSDIIMTKAGLSFKRTNSVIRIAYLQGDGEDVTAQANDLLALSSAYPVYSTVLYDNTNNSYSIEFISRGLGEVLMIKPPQISDISGITSGNVQYSLPVRGQLLELTTISGNQWNVPISEIPIQTPPDLSDDIKSKIMTLWLTETQFYMTNYVNLIGTLSSVAEWARFCLGCGQLLNVPFALGLGNNAQYIDDIANFATYVGSVLQEVLLGIRYDSNWGGLNSNIQSTGNSSYEAYYNHLYVSGALAYCLNAYIIASGNSNVLITYRNVILSFYRDVLNPSTNDESYGLFRNIDWYFAQSYNTGIDAISLGSISPGFKSESEISVAMTSIYSLHLLSKRLSVLGGIGDYLGNLTSATIKIVYNSFVSYYGNISADSALLPVSFVSEDAFGFGSASDFNFAPCTNNPNLVKVCYYSALAAPFTEFSNNEHAAITLSSYFNDLSNLSVVALNAENYSILAYIYSLMAYSSTNDHIFNEAYNNVAPNFDKLAYGVTASNTLLWIANRTAINIS